MLCTTYSIDGDRMLVGPEQLPNVSMHQDGTRAVIDDEI